MRVLADQGIEGFSMREVARMADVPVGSLTYHFEDREDLLVQVSELSQNSVMEWTREYFATRRDEDLASVLGDYIEELTVRNAERLRVDYQLLAASANHEGLRRTAAGWRDKLFEVYRHYADEAHAWAVFYLVEGLLMQSVVHGAMFFCQDVRPIFAAALSGQSEVSRGRSRTKADRIQPEF